MNAINHIILLLCFSLLSAYSFHDDLIPMTLSSETLNKPFLGGFNRPKIQWIDLDEDGDIDLFILDASGYLRYMENHGNPNTPDFHLMPRIALYIRRQVKQRSVRFGGFGTFAGRGEEG